ncbi:MAG: cyclophane-containing peptide 2OG-Fe(II) oxygenase YhhC [Acidobacteriota bacterium]
MSVAPTVRLTSLEVSVEPFPYFSSVEAFGEGVSSAILEWLEARADWELVETEFYEQYEFSLSGESLPPAIEFLTGRPFLEDLRSKVERIFDVRLGDLTDCTAHKLLPGQRIRIHNDFIPDQETHRVLVQLNRGWHADQGGFLMFFNTPDPNDVHRVFSPVHDTVVGFAISENSNHAVSTIHGGERFTLVFSFYGRTGA